jgi:hypothetical protein
MNKQAEIFEEGIDVLRQVLKPLGFHFQKGVSGKSSGGSFITGFFKKDDQKLELHFRFSLGLVSYHFGEFKISHEDYMEQIGGNNKYPGFSENPIDAFHDLAFDLENFCDVFVHGKRQEFEEIVKRNNKREKKSGFKALS